MFGVVRSLTNVTEFETPDIWSQTAVCWTECTLTRLLKLIKHHGELSKTVIL